MADATVFQFSTCCGKLEPILKHLLLCCLGGNLNFLTPQNGKLTNPNNKQETIAPKQQKQQEQQYRQQSHWITMGIFHIAEMQLQNAAYRLPTHTHTHTSHTYKSTQSKENINKRNHQWFNSPCNRMIVQGRNFRRGSRIQDPTFRHANRPKNIHIYFELNSESTLTVK